MKSLHISKKIVLLLILLLATCFLFAGCQFTDPDSFDPDEEFDPDDSDVDVGPTPTQVFEKFKVAYRGEAQETTIVSELADLLVADFAQTWGYGNGTEQNNDILWYDSIRYQVYEAVIEGEIYYKANKDVCWEWSSDNKTTSPILYIQPVGTLKELYHGGAGVESFYATHKETYAVYYSKIYKDCMEVALYEILLGKTDLQNVITVDGFYEDGLPIIRYRGQLVEILGAAPEVEVNLDDIIFDLKEEYYIKSTYWGFSQNDNEKIKNYILEYVIGENASAGNLTSERNYKEYVDDLVDSLITEDSEYKDFARTSFIDRTMTASAEYGYFNDIEKTEYQSIVIMPEQAEEFVSCWLAFQSQRDMNVNVYFRYYDGVTVKTTTPKKINVKAGAFDISKNNNSLLDFGAELNAIMVDVFDNTSQIKAMTERCNTIQQQVYKSVPSLNGFGCVSVLDEKGVDFSFIEIVFDVEKDVNDPINTDYQFQVAIFDWIWQSDAESNETN